MHKWMHMVAEYGMSCGASNASGVTFVKWTNLALTAAYSGSSTCRSLQSRHVCHTLIHTDRHQIVYIECAYGIMCVCRRGALDTDGFISYLPLADVVVDEAHQKPSLIYMRVIYERRHGDQCLIACETHIHMDTCIDLEQARVLSLLRLSR